MAVYRARDRFLSPVRAMCNPARETVWSVPGAALQKTVRTTHFPMYAQRLVTVAVRHAHAISSYQRSSVARPVRISRKHRTATHSVVPDSSTKRHRMCVISVLLVLIHHERAFLCAILARVVATSRALGTPSASAARRARLPQAQARLAAIVIANCAPRGASLMWQVPQSVWIVKPALSTSTKAPLRQSIARTALKVNSPLLLVLTSATNAHVASTTMRAPLQQAQAASSARRVASTLSRVVVPRVTATSANAVNGALKDLTCAPSAPRASTANAPVVRALAMEALPLLAA